MSLSFVPFAEVPPADWDAVVESSPDGWVWALSGWQRLILRVAEWGLEDLSFAVVDGTRLVGVMPLQYQAASRRVGSSGWGIVGPVLSSSVAAGDRSRVIGEMLDEAVRLGRTRTATRFELGMPALTRTSQLATWGVNPLVPFGYTDTSTHSRILHLDRGPEALWASVSENAKRKIKRAQKLGCTVRREPWPLMLDEYYQAHCETYRRTGVTPHPRAYFEGIAEELAPDGRAVLWVGYSPDGTPIAFRNDCRFNGSVLYHTGCSRTEALSTGVNYQLVWEAVQGAIADGWHLYEVGEVFPDALTGKARSLTEFKSRFGGELHRYFKAFLPLEVPAAADAADGTPVAAAPVSSPAPPPPPPAPSSWQAWTAATQGLLRAVVRRVR